MACSSAGQQSASNSAASCTPETITAAFSGGGALCSQGLRVISIGCGGEENLGDLCSMLLGMSTEEQLLSAVHGLGKMAASFAQKDNLAEPVDLDMFSSVLVPIVVQKLRPFCAFSQKPAGSKALKTGSDAGRPVVQSKAKRRREKPPAEESSSSSSAPQSSSKVKKQKINKQPASSASKKRPKSEPPAAEHSDCDDGSSGEPSDDDDKPQKVMTMNQALSGRSDKDAIRSKRDQVVQTMVGKEDFLARLFKIYKAAMVASSSNIRISDALINAKCREYLNSAGYRKKRGLLQEAVASSAAVEQGDKNGDEAESEMSPNGTEIKLKEDYAVHLGKERGECFVAKVTVLSFVKPASGPVVEAVCLYTGLGIYTDKCLIPNSVKGIYVKHLRLRPPEDRRTSKPLVPLSMLYQTHIDEDNRVAERLRLRSATNPSTPGGDEEPVFKDGEAQSLASSKKNRAIATRKKKMVQSSGTASQSTAPTATPSPQAQKRNTILRDLIKPAGGRKKRKVSASPSSSSEESSTREIDCSSDARSPSPAPQTERRRLLGAPPRSRSTDVDEFLQRSPRQPRHFSPGQSSRVNHLLPDETGESSGESRRRKVSRRPQRAASRKKPTEKESEVVADEMAVSEGNDVLEAATSSDAANVPADTAAVPADTADFSDPPADSADASNPAVMAELLDKLIVVSTTAEPVGAVAATDDVTTALQSITSAIIDDDAAEHATTPAQHVNVALLDSDALADASTGTMAVVEPVAGGTTTSEFEVATQVPHPPRSPIRDQDFLQQIDLSAVSAISGASNTDLQPWAAVSSDLQRNSLEMPITAEMFRLNSTAAAEVENGSHGHRMKTRLRDLGETASGSSQCEDVDQSSQSESMLVSGANSSYNNLSAGFRSLDSMPTAETFSMKGDLVFGQIHTGILVSFEQTPRQPPDTYAFQLIAGEKKRIIQVRLGPPDGLLTDSQSDLPNDDFKKITRTQYLDEVATLLRLLCCRDDLKFVPFGCISEVYWGRMFVPSLWNQPSSNNKQGNNIFEDLVYLFCSDATQHMTAADYLEYGMAIGYIVSDIKLDPQWATWLPHLKERTNKDKLIIHLIRSAVTYGHMQVQSTFQKCSKQKFTVIHNL